MGNLTKLAVTKYMYYNLIIVLQKFREINYYYFFTCIDEREAQSICERITPRLAHANAAVVLSAVKVLMKYMEMMSQDADFVTNMTKKLAPPLVTLLSSEPEVSPKNLKKSR